MSAQLLRHNQTVAASRSVNANPLLFQHTCVCVLTQALCSLRAIVTTSATQKHRTITHDSGLLGFETQVYPIAVAGTETADCLPLPAHVRAYS